MTIEDELVELASHTLGASSRWGLTVERDDRGFTLVAEHPASAGLVLETGTLDRDLAASRISAWIAQRAIGVADAAP
jgi:hypothetical protein